MYPEGNHPRATSRRQETRKDQEGVSTGNLSSGNDEIAARDLPEPYAVVFCDSPGACTLPVSRRLAVINEDPAHAQISIAIESKAGRRVNPSAQQDETLGA